MKRIFQFIIGGVIGFISAYAILYFRDMNQSEYIFIYFLFVIIAGLLLWCRKLYSDVKTLHHMPLSGDAEDQADEKMYQKTSDFSMYSNVSLVLSLITLAVSVIKKTSIILIIATIVLLIISGIAALFISKLATYLYSDREFPTADTTTSGNDYVNKMLDVADEGEKMVILQGMYKSNYWMNALLIIAIAFTIVYSALEGTSQLFSIIVMGIILIIGNTTYYRTIRNQ